MKGVCCLQRGDILVLQYPLKKYYAFVCTMVHWKGGKIVTIIHDLGSFRRKKLTINQEIKRLNHSDYIITHNEKMKNWLKEHGCTAQLGVLEIFDYLSDTKAVTTGTVASKPFSILYAGGLSLRKNAFLYEVGQYTHSCTFNLYGHGFELSAAKGKDCFRYMGFVKSDTLIATAQGNFGLVWDGSSTSACTGDFGTYLQYNNPHKTSLYIRCGLPVIIWEKAALADFIRNNNIGICIDSLENLDSILSTLSISEYQEMQKNVALISEKLASGAYFTKSVLKAVDSLENKR